MAPTLILFADIYRDGGSYVLGYSDRAGAQYELEMLVKKDSGGKRSGYNLPTVARYPIESRFSLAWDIAATLEQKLRPLLEAADA